MEFSHVMRARRAIRVFDGRSVPPDVLEDLFGAAISAPSRMNVQPWHFHVATGATRDRAAEVMSLTTSYLEDYVDALGTDGIERAARFYADLGAAPVVVAVSSPHSDDEDEARDFAISVGAAAENLLLAATDRGLGACPLSAPRWIRDALCEVFGVAEGRDVVLLIVVGYPDEAPGPRGRDPQKVTYLR